MSKRTTGYTLIGPLVDDSYRVWGSDPKLSEIVWGTCAYWAKKFRLEHERQLLQAALDLAETPQVFTSKTGTDEPEQLYPRQVAERIVKTVREGLRRDAEEAKRAIN